MNFHAPEQSYAQNTNTRDTYSTMAVGPNASSGSEWRGLEPLEMRSKPRLSNVQESLPSIRTVFSGFESRERPSEAEYKHHPAPFSPVIAERTYNTSPESNKRRGSSNGHYDDENQHQRERYHSVSSGRSPVTVSYRYHRGAASPVRSIARRESLRSVPDSRAYSNHESPCISRPTRDQSILSIPERGAPSSDHNVSRPPFHSPISEPSSIMYRQNPLYLATHDRSYDRSYCTIPAGRSHDDPRSEYSLEACRPYQQHNYAPTHDTSYAPSQSDYGYQQPRNQAYPGPPSYQLNQGQTPFTDGHHSGNYSSTAYQTQDMDSKPRKRRGNLPKPTTDILTAWFINHLEHPYPNEEEKQLLMRQTGLQLNQISNWFINARRRKLPALQNSARAENAARSHHNRMHSADGGHSPMSLCNSDAGLSPRDASTFNEGWSSREERHNQHPY
ncbi:d8a4d969-8539-42df-98b8-1480dba42e05 [Sclerotinia trifoliorum]|uniref:D8a4d969-8539-42df-98b8-1480dba42e05 n=1 Tax=Sclerotinia trifoliorum TaxID=28548 RepID=A0A8H2VVP9_9HELO|nr:d8a4d969-8539-42df-98b8-1480dba42e05 [Sclerotinia trifoliorum]